MPKTYTSPSKRFGGSVVLPDWYDWGRVMAYDAALDRAKAAGSTLEVMRCQADAILLMVDEWHIQGLPEKPTSLPGTPVNAAVNLNRWLLACIGETINQGDDELPFLPGASGSG